MNTLGVIKQFEDYIRQGYGYAQLLEKMNLTEQNVKDLVAEYPAFALVIKSRYGIIIEPNTNIPDSDMSEELKKKLNGLDDKNGEEQPKPTKPLKRKKKEEELKGDATKEVVSE